jgi:hypothetical protein
MQELRIPFTQVPIGRSSLLLILILLKFILCPFLEGFISIKILMGILFSLILISGIYAISEKKLVLIIGLLIALPTLVAQWSLYFLKIPSLELVHRIFGAFFFAYVLIIMVSYLFKEKNVTVEVITSAISVYFLIGLTWTFVFSLLEILQPGSFLLTSQNQVKDIDQLFYYSFVTLTTIGYGDITALTPPAGSLSALEAMMGQIYLAVLVARLVGMYIFESAKMESK